MPCRALLALLVLVVATACSSVSNGTPIAVVVPPSSGPTHGGAPDLASQLLTISEMPAGWSIDNSSKGAVGSPPCISEVRTKYKASAKAEQDFVEGTDFPALQEQLGYFGTTVTARASFEAGSAVLNACKSLSFTSGGVKFTGSIGSLSFPEIGDRSAAWQMVISAEGVTLAIDVVVVQKGAELAAVFYFDIGSVDVGPLTTLVRKAVAKLPA